jgi:hypothetical protein
MVEAGSREQQKAKKKKEKDDVTVFVDTLV